MSLTAQEVTSLYARLDFGFKDDSSGCDAKGDQTDRNSTVTSVDSSTEKGAQKNRSENSPASSRTPASAASAAVAAASSAETVGSIVTKDNVKEDHLRHFKHIAILLFRDLRSCHRDSLDDQLGCFASIVEMLRLRAGEKMNAQLDFYMNVMVPSIIKTLMDRYWTTDALSEYINRILQSVLALAIAYLPFHIGDGMLRVLVSVFESESQFYLLHGKEDNGSLTQLHSNVHGVDTSTDHRDDTDAKRTSAKEVRNTIKLVRCAVYPFFPSH